MVTFASTALPQSIYLSIQIPPNRKRSFHYLLTSSSMPLILSPLTPPPPFLHLSKPTFSTRHHSLRFHSPYTQRRKLSIPRVNGDPDVFTKYSGYLFEEGALEADFIDIYDPKKIAAVYRRKPFLLIRRAFQIVMTLGRWFAFRFIDRVLGRSDQMLKVVSLRLV